MQEGLPSSFTTYVKSFCLSVQLPSEATHSDREGTSLVWIQKLWLKPPPVAVKS